MSWSTSSSVSWNVFCAICLALSDISRSRLEGGERGDAPPVLLLCCICDISLARSYTCTIKGCGQWVWSLTIKRFLYWLRVERAEPTCSSRCTSANWYSSSLSLSPSPSLITDICCLILTHSSLTLLSSRLCHTHFNNY